MIETDRHFLSFRFLASFIYKIISLLGLLHCSADGAGSPKTFSLEQPL